MEKKKFGLHLLFWLAIILLRLLATIDENSLKESIILALYLYGTYALIFYSTTLAYFEFQAKKKHLLFGISLIVITLLFVVFFRTSSRILHFFLEIKMPVGLLKFGIIRVIFIELFAIIYCIAIGKRKAEEKHKVVLHEKTTTELAFLKTQMNPHFFFNTLNNIYGLAYKKDDRTPEIIVKLSEIMRYIIYETTDDYVPLQKEITFIENYINLENLRIRNAERVKLNIDINNPIFKIAPLILLPFIENCFKHGDINGNRNGSIEVNIWTESDTFYFSCSNSFKNNKVKKSGGVGLNNVKKRLEILYADEFNLTISTENGLYYVLLELSLIK